MAFQIIRPVRATIWSPGWVFPMSNRCRTPFLPASSRRSFPARLPMLRSARLTILPILIRERLPRLFLSHRAVFRRASICLGSGTIYGTPTQVGSFSATINASTPGGTNSLTCNITVNPANFFVKHVFVVDGTVTNDGQNPNSLVQGSDGNLYGTTAAGGSVTQVVLGNTYHPDGTFFQMTPAGKVSILHNFGDGTVPNDGTQPNAGLVQGSDGSFYRFNCRRWSPIYGGENGVRIDL